MADTDIVLKTVVKGASQASSELAKVDKSIGGISKTALKAGAALTAAFAVGAVKTAASFETQMAKVATLLDKEMLPNLKNMESQLLALASTTPQSLDALTEGLFYVVSAGVEAADQMEFLATATRLADAGSTDLSTSIKAVVGTMKAYGDASGSAAEVADQLFLINKKGFTTFEEVANAMPKVTSAANALGVSQKELSAAMATLVGSTGNADEVSTQLQGTFTALMKPGTELQAALNKLGFETGFAAVEALGFKGTLDELRKVTGGTDEGMSGLFNNVRALKGVLPLAGALTDTFGNNLEEMEDATGAVNEASDTMNRTLEAQAGILKNQLTREYIKLGQDGVGPLTLLLEELNERIRFGTQAQESAERQLPKTKKQVDELAKTVRNASGDEKDFAKIVLQSALERTSAHKAASMAWWDQSRVYTQAADDQIDKAREWLEETDMTTEEVARAFHGASDEVIVALGTIDTELARTVKEQTEASREWGAHMIENFLSGMESKQGDLGAGVSAVVGIMKRLKFSTNKEMPTEVWGQHSMENFAAGMAAATPAVSKSAQEVIDVIKGIGYAQDIMTKDGIDGIKQLQDAYETSIEGVRTQLNNLRDTLNDIFSDFADKESEERRKVGEAIAESDEKVAQLRKEVMEEEDESRRSQLRQELEAELQAREELRDRIANFEKETTEAKRVNGLTQLQLAFERFDKEIEKAKELRDTRLAALDDELVSARDNWGKLRDLHNERTKQITELLGDEATSNQELRSEAQKAWQQIRDLITELNNLKQARRDAGFSEGGIVPGFAEGGIVQRFASGGFAQGTDTVPAMLTPGELILNRAQQKNLAGGMGGINVHIEGVFGSDAAEEIGDMIVQKLQMASAI